MIPTKRIVSPDDNDKWIDSPTYNVVVDFIQQLQDLAIGLTNDAEVVISAPTQQLLSILDKTEAIIEANPVVHEKDISRFGKVEFRDFYDDLSKKSRELIEPLVGEKWQEVSTYFVESWGNRTRIDYGSGHELNFMAFLICLKKLDIISDQDLPALAIKVFPKYIEIMRRLQKLYWLEPAGSHGVWGLDDYHFLPFLIGSAQLSTHPHMKPKLIHNQELVELYYKQYMYLECIHFINSIKTLPKTQNEKLSLRWHSPMLDDILAAKSWQKIKDGMVKMYKAEVLAKLPIMQHFMFGEILKCPQGISETHNLEDDCGHVHEAINTWGDCCGIKIPSAIGASESLKMKGLEFKQLPFD